VTYITSRVHVRREQASLVSDPLEPLAGTGREFSNQKAFDRGNSPQHFCGVFQPACGAPTSSDRDRAQGGRQRPREHDGFNCAAPVHAVTVVTRGSDTADVGSRSSYGNK
jgi:hypothetical protein